MTKAAQIALTAAAVAAVGVAVVAVFGFGPRKVDITWNPEMSDGSTCGPGAGSDQCVSLSYPGCGAECAGAGAAVIETKGLFAKKKVQWRKTEDAGEVYYRIYWGNIKPDAMKNYLEGPYSIDCSSSKVKSIKPCVDGDPGCVDGVPKGGVGRWPYFVEVYACTDGTQGDCLCKTDPMVIIRDN